MELPVRLWPVGHRLIRWFGHTSRPVS